MATSNFHVTVPKLILVSAIALGVGGCASLSGFSPPVSVLLFLMALTVGGLVGCRQTDQQPSDTWTVEGDTAVDAVDARDGEDPPPPDTERGEGRWVQCCRNGEIDSCFCRAGVSCNYGRFKSCGGGKCVPRFGYDVGCPTDAGDTDIPPDTKEPDTDVPPDTYEDTREPTDTARGEGRWVTCCKDGHLDTCFCPANVACNYGQFKRCGGDRCVTPGFGADAGCPVDAGGDTAGKF